MGQAASNFLVPSAQSQLKGFVNFQKFSKTQILAFLSRFNCKQYIKDLKDWDIIYNLVLTMLLIWRKLVQRLLGLNLVAFFGEPPYLSMRSQKFNVLIKDRGIYYLILTVLSFSRKFNNGLLGLKTGVVFQNIHNT